MSSDKGPSKSFFGGWPEAPWKRMNYHPADIGISLDNHGSYRAMILAASRGDMDGYKLALKQSYGPAAKRVYEKTVDQIYEYALKEAWKLMDANTEAEEKTLLFWAMVIENHEDRYLSEAVPAGK